MAEEDQEQKTEHPTGRRLDEARGKGQLPISREVSALVMMIAILMVLGLMAPVMAGHLVTYLQAFIAMPESIHLSLSGVQNLLFEAVLHVGLATGLIFAFLLTVAVLGTMVQTGFFYAPHLLMPDLSRLNPIRGWKKLFSPMGLVEFFKSVAKMSVLGLVAYFVLKPIVGQLSLMPGRDLLGTMVYMHRKTVHLILMLALTFMWIAIPDLLYQRWHYIKMLRMSKEEVKDEYKQMEGDPKIKSRLRQIRMEKARKRMMAAIPKADVVVTNPTHYAVALQYDGEKMAAPVVLAKGINLIAQKIRELAEEHKVPLVSNPPLARALYDTVEIDREIPTQHYRAVAEIISYVYKLKKRKF